MSTTAGRAGGRLDIGDAVHDGWLAFSRSPRAFVGFPLLITALLFLFEPLMGRITSDGLISTDPIDWVVSLIGLAGRVGLYLWGAIGLVRGAWQALEGHHPTLRQLMRWDGPAIARLLKAWLLVLLLIIGPLLVILVLVGGPLFLLYAFAEQLAAINLVLLQLMGLLFWVLLLLLLGMLLIGVVYLYVNQKFLTQICLLEGPGPVATVRRGRQLVDSQWLLLLLLTVVQAILMALGLLACGVGFFVAWPVVACVSTAAYRQLITQEASVAVA